MSEISQPSTTSTPIPLPSLADAAIIANLKQQLDTAQQQLDSTQQRLQFAELKVQMLEEKLRLQRIAKYGPSSEKLATLQMELLEEEPGVSDEEVQAESQRERLPSTRNRRKHPGRQSLPANLPRVERVIACTPAQCVCGQCGSGDRGDRLRGERASGCGAAEVLRRGDQARKEGLQELRGAGCDGGAAAAKDHREKPGERSRGDRHAD